MHKKTSYHDSLNFLYSLHKYGIKFGLSKTANLLKACGNPHQGRSYIHVAGTNGKGSVAAMLAGLLAQAGVKVGFYSSPHLVRFTERIRVNGREIAPERIAVLTAQLRRVLNPHQPSTFFEFTTALALVYFAEEQVDMAVMEVGMGGRLDATNVIRPLVSIITNVGLDHQAFLGKRLIDIAGEKAGIIKNKVPLITAEARPDLKKIFQSICAQKKAPFWQIGTDIRYQVRNQKLDYFGLKQRFKGLELGLRGRYQFRNAAVALGAMELLEKSGFKLTEAQIRQGLAQTFWPGRMQVVAQNPLTILDGAHNPAGMRQLVHSLKSDWKYRNLVLVLGIMHDKDIPGMLKTILPMADRVIYTRPAYERAAVPQDLLRQAAEYHQKGEVMVPLNKALERARALARADDLVLVCGSLFTVGEALTYYDPITYKPDKELLNL
ncbi:MAG: bifunctional folylpolyglutamate synthase/dihydrofolate synthase [Desulfobacteraceae bacterium]|nr:MAG: bifunctional folylpolyglutamate synthase/dihydrofolate synthase [Desulfobacteraceae bacterium]